MSEVDAKGDSNPKLMWFPDPNRVTKLDNLRNQINKKYKVSLGGY